MQIEILPQIVAWSAQILPHELSQGLSATWDAVSGFITGGSGDSTGGSGNSTNGTGNNG